MSSNNNKLTMCGHKGLLWRQLIESPSLSEAEKNKIQYNCRAWQQHKCNSSGRGQEKRSKWGTYATNSPSLNQSTNQPTNDPSIDCGINCVEVGFPFATASLMAVICAHFQTFHFPPSLHSWSRRWLLHPTRAPPMVGFMSWEFVHWLR